MSQSTVQEFETHRARLLGMAYRLLGTMAEAEDVVQDTYLRFCRVDQTSVRNVAAFLNTVTTRLCLDQLRSAQVKRTQYVGQWLPEPVATDEETDRESISMALLVVLERLSPPERAVYVLHQAFDYSFGEIAEITGKTVANCRQIFHRAKRHVVAARPRFTSSQTQHRALVGSFMAACASGDLAQIRSLLADGVCLTSDGGGQVQALTRSLTGADEVAKFFAHLANRAPGDVRVDIRSVNGAPSAVIYVDDAVNTVLSFEPGSSGIVAIHAVRNPDKLRYVAAPMQLQ